MAGKEAPALDVCGSRVEIKWLSVGALVFQNTALMIIMKYSLSQEGETYLATTAVLLQELLKLVLCCGDKLSRNKWRLEVVTSVLMDVGELDRGGKRDIASSAKLESTATDSPFFCTIPSYVPSTRGRWCAQGHGTGNLVHLSE